MFPGFSSKASPSPSSTGARFVDVGRAPGNSFQSELLLLLIGCLLQLAFSLEMPVAGRATPGGKLFARFPGKMFGIAQAAHVTEVRILPAFRFTVNGSRQHVERLVGLIHSLLKFRAAQGAHRPATRQRGFHQSVQRGKGGFAFSYCRLLPGYAGHRLASTSSSMARKSASKG